MRDDGWIVNLRSQLGHAFADAVQDQLAALPDHSAHIDPAIIAGGVVAALSDDPGLIRLVAEWQRRRLA